MGNGSVRTRIIGDQQVDITRQLNPVWVDTRRADSSGSITLSTTTSYTVVAQMTHTIPSFVGTADFLSFGQFQVQSSGHFKSVIQYSTFAVGTEARWNHVDVVSMGPMVGDRITISSPGASIEVYARARTTNVTTAETATASVYGIGIGIR